MFVPLSRIRARRWALACLGALALMMASCGDGALVADSRDSLEDPDDDPNNAPDPAPNNAEEGDAGVAPDGGGEPDVGDPVEDASNSSDAADDAEGDPDLGQEEPIDCGELATCGRTCVDLQSDPTSCGFCGRTCVLPHAQAGCSAGECVLSSCDPGFFDVDGDLANGCEVEDLCTEGDACQTACGSQSVTACQDGVSVCEIPDEACNLVDDDCDGACDEGSLPGCRRGIHRAYGNGHVYSDDLNFASSDPYNLERQNYFHLYSETGPSLRPVFLCQKPGGKRLLTSETACEIGRAPERTIGFWSPTPQCGAVPLYRLYKADQDNHFYTISAPERDNARDNLGYVEQGIAGYVWTTP